MNDPIDDPAEAAKPLRGQLGLYSADYLAADSERVAWTMLPMLRQKVTRYPADYLLTDT